MSDVTMLAGLCFLAAGCVGSRQPSPSSADESGSGALSGPHFEAPVDLYRAVDESTLLAAARELILADENAALVTVDSTGQPRVRTVRAFPEDVDPSNPAKGVTVWVMTRKNTRKLEQIRQHPKVTLYFNDDAATSYLTIMGEAVIHTDPEERAAKRFYDDEYAAFFWPDLERDFVMIQVVPRWIEFMGPSVPNHPETWRPQSVVLSR